MTIQNRHLLVPIAVQHLRIESQRTQVQYGLLNRTHEKEISAQHRESAGNGTINGSFASRTPVRAKQRVGAPDRHPWQCRRRVTGAERHLGPGVVGTGLHGRVAERHGDRPELFGTPGKAADLVVMRPTRPITTIEQAYGQVVWMGDGSRPDSVHVARQEMLPIEKAAHGG